MKKFCLHQNFSRFSNEVPHYNGLGVGVEETMGNQITFMFTKKYHGNENYNHCSSAFIFQNN